MAFFIDEDGRLQCHNTLRAFGFKSKRPMKSQNDLHLRIIESWLMAAKGWWLITSNNLNLIGFQWSPMWSEWPSPHHLSDHCPSQVPAWCQVSQSKWDLEHPWHRWSKWWDRSQCPCWNLNNWQPIEVPKIRQPSWSFSKVTCWDTQQFPRALEWQDVMAKSMANLKIWSPGTSYLVCLSLNFISDIIEVGEFLVADLPHKFPPALGAVFGVGAPNSKIPKTKVARLVENCPSFIFSVLLPFGPAPSAQWLHISKKVAEWYSS